MKRRCSTTWVSPISCPVITREQSDLTTAELTIQRELKNRAEEAKALYWLGSAHDNLKEFEQAISYHEQVLAIKRELKDSSPGG